MDLTTVLIIATVIAAVVVAALEVAKTTFNIPKRFLPIAALAVGFLIGLSAIPLTDYTIYELLWGGGIAGLAAAGLFDLTKATKKE